MMDGMHPEHYLPITTIYNLLALSRKGLAANPEQLRRGMQQRMGPGKTSTPRLSFWLRLCQAASLLDEAQHPVPTLLVEQWLAWSYIDQMAHLLEAWQQVPESEKYRRERQRLLDRLVDARGAAESQQQLLGGLHALGLVEGHELSALGQALLSGKSREEWSGVQPAPWVLTGEWLQVTFPADWKLLWELEQYLDPHAPGIYQLDSAALRQAGQQEVALAHSRLVEILTAGLGGQLPEDLVARLAAQPFIRVIPGPVLEFSSPQELVSLRQSGQLRQHLERLLSPRHVALDAWQAPLVMQRLYRQGLLAERDLLDWRASRTLPGTPGTALSRSDRVYLLSLLLLAEGLQNVVAAPLGLLERLSRDLDDTLRAAAARRASETLEAIHPRGSWQPEVEPPPPPADALVSRLQQAIEREETIDILYQASGRHTPEARHLTPLLIEERGARTYLIAYCHARRANRTFRLDRLELIESHPPS